MESGSYIAFVAATTILILIPGPSVMLTIGHSLTHGAGAAMFSVAGTSLAVLAQLIVVGIGMTSVLLLLAEGFEWLRWAGVAYLLWAGLIALRAGGRGGNGGGDGERPASTRRALFWQGFVVSATNPKSLIFYAAFFPQFIDPLDPPLVQLLVLSATFLAIAAGLTTVYALLAGRLGRWLGGHARLRHRLSGVVLIGAGLGLALARRS